MDIFVKTDDEPSGVLNRDPFTLVNYGKKKCIICFSHSVYKYCKKCYDTFTSCENSICNNKSKSKYCSEQCYYIANNKPTKYKPNGKLPCKQLGCANKTNYDVCRLCYERYKKMTDTM